VRDKHNKRTHIGNKKTDMFCSTGKKALSMGLINGRTEGVAYINRNAINKNTLIPCFIER
jgi:hypothetical protein